MVTNLSASMNYNKSEFDSDPSAVLNAEDQFDFENNVPQWRSVFTATQTFDRLTVLGRASYYGESENSNNNGAPLSIQKFDSTIFVDVEGSYQINEMFRVSAGGRNILDEFPDEDEIADFCCGRIYASSSVVGWQGGYYYLRMNASF
jgi:iron complex outermembrane receptor protein